MPFDGSGNFTRSFNFTTDKSNGIKVVSDRMDGEFDNFATAMNQVFLRTGVAPLTGSINMGTNGIVALGDGSISSPAIRFNSSTNTGLYSSGFAKVALAAGGVQRIEANSTGAAVTGALTISSNGTVSGNLTVTGTTTHTGAVTFGSGATQFNGDVGILAAPVASTQAKLQVTGDAALFGTGVTTLGFNTYYASAAWKQGGTTGYAAAIALDPTAGVMTFGTSPASVAATVSNSLTERMRINAAGNVGIGAATLAARLHVNGTVTIGSQANVAAVFGQGSTSDLMVGSIGGGVPFLASQGATPIAFYTNAVERMRVASTGELGIGSTSPVSQASYGGLTINGSTGSAASFGVASTEVARVQADTAFKVLSITSIPLTFGTVNAERGRFDTSGNFGIGTTNPQAPLHVISNGRIDNTSSQGRLEIWNGASNYGGFGTSGWVLGSSATDIAVNATSGRGIVFYTNGSTTEKMRLDTSGNLGLGTASAVNNAGYAGLSLNGSTGAIISGMVGGVEKSRIVTDTSLTVGTVAAVPIVLATSSAARITITSSGEVYMAAAQSPTQVYDVGYLGIPQVGAAKVVNYTCVLSDAGQHVQMNAAALTVTIPANATVAYPIGTTLTFVNINAASLTIAITTDTMTLANSTTTGARALAQNGIATALKISATTWLISGAGLT